MRAKFGRGPTVVPKKGSQCISRYIYYIYIYIYILYIYMIYIYIYIYMHDCITRLKPPEGILSILVVSVCVSARELSGLTHQNGFSI